MAPGPLSNAEKFVNKVTAAPDATLDAADIATAKTEGSEIVERAKELARAEREKLRKEIAEAAAASAAPDEQNALNKLADDIQNIPEPVAPAAQEEPAKKEGFDPKNIDATAEKILEKANVKPNVILSFLALFMKKDGGLFKGISNFLNGISDPGNIRSAMEKRLGVKIAKGDTDKADAQTLREQYVAELDAQKKTEATLSFETFYQRKIDQLAKTPKASYALADLVALPSAEEAKVDAEKKAEQDKADAAKKEKEEKEKPLKENPELAYLTAFRDALNSIKKGAVTGEKEDDIKASILKAFNAGDNAGYNNFGLELDGDVLEEADGKGYWFGADWNLLDNWGTKMNANPVGAIEDFLAIDPAKWESTNPTAARTLQKVRAFMATKGIEPSAIAPSAMPAPDAPTETPAGKDA